MNDAELLRAALRNLWDGRSPMGAPSFLDALHTACAPSEHEWRLSQKIRERLNGLGNEMDWLLYRHNIDTPAYSPRTRQDYRRRWMLNMIAEAESNGGFLE